MRTLILEHGIAHAYTAFMSTVDPTKQGGDAIGIYGGPADLYRAYLGPATSLFSSELFTELTLLTDSVVDISVGNNTVPFLPKIATCENNEYCAEIGARFMNNRSGIQPFANHQHVMICAIADTVNSELGSARNLSDFFGRWTPSVFLNQQAIVNSCAQSGTNSICPDDGIAVAGEIAAHELVHTFDVNPPASMTEGHCGSQAYTSGYCRMVAGTVTPPAEQCDNVIALHNYPWETSEYRRVRRRAEPLPQYWATSATPNP